MKNDRQGETLWHEWDGDGYDSVNQNSVVYYTFGRVDTAHEVVRRALASAVQRDGVAESLSKAYMSIDDSTLFYGHVGVVDGAPFESLCSDTGETFFGDLVEGMSEVTIIEVKLHG